MVARLGPVATHDVTLAVALSLALCVALVVAGCATDPTDRRSLSPDEVPTSLVGRPLAIAEIGDLELLVAVADTPDSRRRGLMGVDDFSVVDGMVFVFDGPTETGFHMKDVPVPLDIAFVGVDGSVVGVRTMARCTGDPCPLYHSPAPFLWAVETPVGGLAAIAPGARFSLRP